MHVALYSPAWPPSTHHNGVVTYVRWLRNGLHALGHRVTVVTPVLDVPEPGVVLVPEIGPVGWRATIAARLRGAMPTVFNSGRREIVPVIARLHQHDPIDIVEMEESFGWAGEVSDGIDMPLVVKLHGPAFLHLVEEELATPFGQERVLREGQALARLPFIISPSSCHLRDTIARYRLKPEIAEHVVNPLALDGDQPLWRLDTCDRQSVLFVGRFDKVKGGDLVILAFQLLLRARPDMRLVFVGPDRGLVQTDGSRIGLREFLSGLADPALSAAVDYRGPLAPEQIGPLRTRALCVLVTSRVENQAYTVLEAMLQGCPLVCTDNSGTSEMIDHGVTGLLATSDSPPDIAQQLQRLVDVPELAQALGAEARRQALVVHAPAVVAACNVGVYERAIAIHERSRARSHAS